MSPETGYGFDLQDGDWTRVRQLFQFIGSSLRLGPTGKPTLTNLSLLGDLTVAGSGRFDGGIGIGTDSVARLLRIYGSTATLGVGLEIDNLGNADAIVRFALAGDAKFVLGVDNSVAGDPFKISVGGALGTNDALTIDSSGNFVIPGTIAGGAYNGVTFSTNDLVIDDVGNNNSLLVAGDNQIWDNTDGFGITGGSTPRDLTVTGGDWTIDQSVASGASPTFGDISLGFGDLVSEQNPDPANAIRIKGTSSDVDVVLGSASGYFSVYNAADDTNVFNVSDRGNTVIAGDLTVDTNTLFVDAGNDRVGIGTISPDSVFHIKANVPGTVGSHPAGQLIIQDPDDTVFGNAVITGYESDGAGNPDQQLWYLGSSSSSNSNIIFLNRRNSTLQLGTNGVSRLTILGNGNVGIGTVTPSVLLDVNGVLQATTINAFSLGGKLTGGANEIEGSAFDINGGTMDGVTIATDCTQTEWDAAYTHSQDNSQAHTDYLLNNANDAMVGILALSQSAAAGLLTLAGYGTKANRRGGGLYFSPDGGSTSTGYVFANSDNKFVWKATAQSSNDDTGVAWLDFDTGAFNAASMDILKIQTDNLEITRVGSGAQGAEIEWDGSSHYQWTGDGTLDGGLGIAIPGAATGGFYYGYGGTEQHYFNGAIKLKEQAAAAADTADYGQIWTKNNAGTTELWFTDDAGNDNQIAYV